MKTEIIDVLSWAAVFDQGLKSSDVLRYLTKKSTIEEVSAVLRDIDEFEQREGRWYLSGKEYSRVDYKKTTASATRHLKEGLPIVSKLCETSSILGVGITGSLASGSSVEGADVDLLIVTKADYVWRVRALAVYLEHSSRGDTRICPNMVLDHRDLKLRPSVYAARELAMMRPVKGREIFEEMISQNPWFLKQLPNANLSPSIELTESIGKFPLWWGAMRLPVLGILAEKWEARRRISECRKETSSLESVYEKLRCIGHESEHRSRIEGRMVEISMEVSTHERRLQ